MPNWPQKPSWLLGIAAAAALGIASGALDASAAGTREAKKKKTAHGAIAWHAATGNLGYSHDFADARAANIEALRQCGHERCEVMLSLANECGAIANGPRGPAAKKGNTRAEAETRALNACGKDCRPVGWACTR